MHVSISFLHVSISLSQLHNHFCLCASFCEKVSFVVFLRNRAQTLHDQVSFDYFKAIACILPAFEILSNGEVRTDSKTGIPKVDEREEDYKRVLFFLTNCLSMTELILQTSNHLLRKDVNLVIFLKKSLRK